MRSDRIAQWLIVVAVVAVVAAAAGSAAADENGATASLPLDEVLRLYRAADADTEESPPPLPYAVDRIELDGRLLDDALELKAHVEVSVISDGVWVTVPLLRRSGTLHLTDMPRIEDAAFVDADGWLAMTARTRGRYVFDLDIVQRAAVNEERRKTALEVATTALAVMRLDFDRTVFRLRSATTIVRDDRAVLFPSDGGFTVEWARLQPLEERVEAAPPPVDPIVRRAQVDVVSTLEGERVWRVLYELRLQTAETLECELPENLQLLRAYRNGVAVPAVVENSTITVEAHPTRSGRDTGTVELALADASGGYLLAGDLEFTVPRPRWPVHELFVRLHLPATFNYSWTGGSLGPADQFPEVKFSHTLPTPGKTVLFHQYLVTSSSPRLTLSYTIDLDGRYFRTDNR